MLPCRYADSLAVLALASDVLLMDIRSVLPSIPV